MLEGSMASPLGQEELCKARRALAQLYRRHASRLRWWVARRLGMVVHLSADDVVQEAFCRTWERICQGELPEELWSSELWLYRWLCGTCWRIMHEAYRQRVYALAYPLEEPVPQEVEQEVDDSCSPLLPPLHGEEPYSPSAWECLQSTELEQLEKALQDEVFKLAEPYRTVLLLRYWEEWDWLKIAQQLRVSRQTLYRWHTHAVGLLRQKLMPYVFWRA